MKVDVAGVQVIELSHLRAFLCMFFMSVFATPSLAHPTFIVDARATVGVNDARELSEIQVAWIFDEAYSFTLIATGGYDPDGDGVLTAEESNELAAMHTYSLEDFGWFAKLVADGDEQSFLPPDSFRASLEDQKFVIDFTLRPNSSLVLGEEVLIFKIFDPSFVVAFLLRPEELKFEGPDGCTLETDAGSGKFSDTAFTGMNVSPEEGASIAESMAPPIRVFCK